MTDTMTDDQFIQHYGVPGMKWGKRKGEGGDAKPSPRAERRAAKKAESAQRDANIEKARSNLKDKSKQLEEVAASTYSAKTETGRRRAEAQYDRLEKEFFDGPDFAMANQMTRGETIANNISVGILVGLSAAAIGINVAATAARR